MHAVRGHGVFAAGLQVHRAQLGVAQSGERRLGIRRVDDELGATVRVAHEHDAHARGLDRGGRGEQVVALGHRGRGGVVDDVQDAVVHPDIGAGERARQGSVSIDRGTIGRIVPPRG